MWGAVVCAVKETERLTLWREGMFPRHSKIELYFQVFKRFCRPLKIDRKFIESFECAFVQMLFTKVSWFQTSNWSTAGVQHGPYGQSSSGSMLAIIKGFNYFNVSAFAMIEIIFMACICKIFRFFLLRILKRLSYCASLSLIYSI